MFEQMGLKNGEKDCFDACSNDEMIKFFKLANN